MEKITGRKVKAKITGIKETREVYINEEFLDPAESQKVRNLSPTGFNWGYRGDGPAQLALGILLKFTDEETALEYYQPFKEDIIACLPQEDFEIEIDVEEWLRGK